MRRDGAASFAIVLKNVSTQRILVARRPQVGNIVVEFRGGGAVWSSCGFDEITGAADFAWVEPGATLEIPVDLDKEDFGSAQPGKRTMAVGFIRNGNEWGLNAWMGGVEVQVAWGQ